MCESTEIPQYMCHVFMMVSRCDIPEKRAKMTFRVGVHIMSPSFTKIHCYKNSSRFLITGGLNVDLADVRAVRK